jgi:hypothetical protein
VEEAKRDLPGDCRGDGRTVGIMRAFIVGLIEGFIVGVFVATVISAFL